MKSPSGLVFNFLSPEPFRATSQQTASLEENYYYHRRESRGDGKEKLGHLQIRIPSNPGHGFDKLQIEARHYIQPAHTTGSYINQEG
ncbi:hypothetical protein TNIN_47331 [Trichonephila inaurata madagascariensis]|uniref:Uncharacterized protein n=1 Tax=Trichonephila inaurata madagascariensis TaxID=2747483 RepID=A0A8X6YAI1_9ARAC|nr:hypothetical protein TNIN_47331 [Trichonephila inaurata madagascariensis]